MHRNRPILNAPATFRSHLLTSGGDTGKRFFGLRWEICLSPAACTLHERLLPPLINALLDWPKHAAGATWRPWPVPRCGWFRRG